MNLRVMAYQEKIIDLIKVEYNSHLDEKNKLIKNIIQKKKLLKNKIQIYNNNILHNIFCS